MKLLLIIGSQNRHLSIANELLKKFKINDIVLCNRHLVPQLARPKDWITEDSVFLENHLKNLENDEITCKGEIVIVLSSKREPDENFSLSEEEGKKFLKYLSTKDASKLIYELYGHNKQSVYKFLSDISKENI